MSGTFHLEGDTVPLVHGRPLLVVDADEVLLAFARGFDRFLLSHGCRLDLVSYRLHGNVRSRDDNSPLLDIEVPALLDEFRTELDWLEPIEGAQQALAELATLADVVVLSNVTPAQAPARLRNLVRLGWSFPLIANSGPKGPAVRALARRADAIVFFIDDIPMHHQSVADTAPDVWRIHFIGDERLKPLLPPSPHAHVKAEDWDEVVRFVRERLKEI